MGPETAATREVLMDAVEAVMRDDGYAALSARHVAARAGLKYQIVFYYFERMDDLLLAAYRRRTQTVLARTLAALDSPRPLHAFWQAASDPSDAALSLEYMAMSNHNPLIRAETIAFGEQMRWLVAERLSAGGLSQPTPDEAVFTPFAISMAISSIGGIFGFESALGISGGRQETRALVEWCLNRLEPDAPA
jgi:AcrR family transcriptional regulator